MFEYNCSSLNILLQLPGLSFRVDHLPMSETVMGIWSSLVRLAGTAAGSSSAALPGALFQPPSLTKKPSKSPASKMEAERRWNSRVLFVSTMLSHLQGKHFLSKLMQ